MTTNKHSDIEKAHAEFLISMDKLLKLLGYTVNVTSYKILDGSPSIREHVDGLAHLNIDIDLIKWAES